MSDLVSKRVLYLITELNPGGAQVVLFRLLSRLDLCKYDPQVVCFYNGNSFIADNIRNLGIPVTDIGFSKPWKFIRLWRLWMKLKGERPIILHCWLFHANLVGRLLGYCLKVPVIITSRRNVVLIGKFREQLKCLTRKMDDAIIAVCDLARNAEIEGTKVNPEKVITIYNGIDVNNFEIIPFKAKMNSCFGGGENPESIILGSVGRLCAQKGFIFLINALDLLVEENPYIKLIIVGEGKMRSTIENHVQKLGLSENVQFLGYQNNILEILRSMDIFVLPSLWEGMPNAILEAMAAGLPVVATNVGGTPEVVVDGETGFLVPPRDPEALANAIQRLIDDPELRKKFGQAGRERVERHFTIQETVRKTEELYLRLLAEKGIQV
jgi:glycosyltransferase involved in cell wall biosynthesis